MGLNKIILLTGVYIISCQWLIAQSYKYSCTTDTIPESGFYKIPVTPELSARCKTDFSDIRITDIKNQQVPYVIRNSYPYLKNTSFVDYPVIKNELIDSGRSLIIIENKMQEKLYQLFLVLKNTAVNRFATLSGSNDKNNWFIIDEKILIRESHELTTDHYVQSIQFPLSDYRFFKLVVNNAGTDPLHIEKTGVYIETGLPYNKNHATSYTQNPQPIITQKDSLNGKSYIKINQSNKFQFDNVDISITGPVFFARKAELYMSLNDNNDNKLESSPFASFLLQANASHLFNVPRQKATSFYLVITNNNNPPLQVENIDTRQFANEIVAYFEKGKQYHLLLDDPSAIKANYDLEKFRDSIPANIAAIHIGIITENKNTSSDEPQSNSKKWIWVSIIIAGMVLAFFTYRLSSDIKKSGS